MKWWQPAAERVRLDTLSRTLTTGVAMNPRRALLLLVPTLVVSLGCHCLATQPAAADGGMVEGEAFQVFHGDALRNMGWNEVEVFVRERNFSFTVDTTQGLRVFRPDPRRYERGGRFPRQEPWSVGERRLPKKDVDAIELLLKEQERLQPIAASYLRVDDRPVPVATWRTDNKIAGEWIDYILNGRGIRTTKTGGAAGESMTLVEAADLVEARATLESGRAERLRAPEAKITDFEFKITTEVIAK